MGHSKLRGGTVGIGDTLPVKPGSWLARPIRACTTHVGQEPLALYETDPGATWNASRAPLKIAAPQAIVPMAALSIQPAHRSRGAFRCRRVSCGRLYRHQWPVTITNIMGFFIVSQAQAGTLGIRHQRQSEWHRVRGDGLVSWPHQQHEYDHDCIVPADDCSREVVTQIPRCH